MNVSIRNYLCDFFQRIGTSVVKNNFHIYNFKGTLCIDALTFIRNVLLTQSCAIYLSQRVMLKYILKITS